MSVRQWVEKKLTMWWIKELPLWAIILLDTVLAVLCFWIAIRFIGFDWWFGYFAKACLILVALIWLVVVVLSIALWIGGERGEKFLARLFGLS